MSAATRILTLCLLISTLSVIGFAQAKSNNPGAVAALGGSLHYTKKAPVDARQFQPPQLTLGSGTVLNAKNGTVVGSTPGQSPVHSRRVLAGTIDGIDSIPTFDTSFAAQNGPDSQFQFRFTMIGGDPIAGKTTNIPVQMDEISLQLLKADGSVLADVPFAPFENLTLQSPNFNTADYRSGRQLQFGDAVQRAEFFNRMDPTWHTNLQPSVVNRVTIQVPPTVQIQLQNGSIITATSYFAFTAPDGNTVVLMLDILFDFFFGNEVNNEINLGNFNTHAINVTAFPNTFLYSLNVAHPNLPGSCCVGGFHTYFFDPSATQPPFPRLLTAFVSWTSAGIFQGGVADVTGMSHEIAESLNDPFLDNVTPPWQFPIPGLPPNAQVCQGNLETGDVVEVLPTSTIPVPLKDRGQTFLYHPQTEALYQWFEMGPSSNAVDGAFSFPDESALAHSAVPCPH
jgi:hypothetical protein